MTDKPIENTPDVSEQQWLSLLLSRSQTRMRVTISDGNVVSRILSGDEAKMSWEAEARSYLEWRLQYLLAENGFKCPPSSGNG